jgi:hypothetical protein
MLSAIELMGAFCFSELATLQPLKEGAQEPAHAHLYQLN